MHRMYLWGGAPLAAIALALVPTSASAGRCPSTYGDEVAQLDTSARYELIQTTLAREARKGMIWNHAWGWGLLGTAIGQVGIGLAVPEDECPECWYVGAGKSMLGVASTFVLNPVKIRRVRQVDGAPTCEQLAIAEAALAAAAKSERVHWFRHVEGFAVNIAATLYIGLEHDEWGKAALGFAVGMAVGEYRLYTRPDGAIKTLARYEKGEVAAKARSSTPWTVVPTVGREAFGLSLAIGF
jgi:hypothetical protein